MKVSSLCVASVCLVMAAAGMASAQQRPRGEGGPPVGGRMVGGMGIEVLLANEAVQKEIGATPQQSEAWDAYRQQRRAERPERPEGRPEGTPEERRARFQQMAAERAAQTEAKAKEIFGADKLERVKQIRWQVMDAAALLDTEVQDRLNLPEDKRQQLGEVAANVRTAMRERFQARDPDAGREQFREQMQAMRDELRTKSMAVLTAEERQAFGKLMGEPTKVEPSDLMPRRAEPGTRQREGEGRQREGEARQREGEGRQREGEGRQREGEGRQRGREGQRRRPGGRPAQQ